MISSECFKCILKSVGHWMRFTTSRKFTSMKPCLKAVHTTKGWKTVARTGEKPPKLKATVHPLSCEEGHGAVPHDLLISKLQNCSSVRSQIETFTSTLSLPHEAMEERKMFCKSLEDMFRMYFPQLKVHLFGSSLNGLGFKGCDADVSIQTLFNNEEYVTNLPDVPSLDSVLNGTTSADVISRLTPIYMMRFVRRILRKHSSNIKEPILLVKARVPILRFYDSKHDVFCDFSCESAISLRNTRLLRLSCFLDKRFEVVAKLARYWGKHGGFVGDIDMFNSYSFSLLVLYFLQNTSPPVLPSIKEMLEKSIYLQSGSADDDELLFKEMKKFSPSENEKTAEELFREFCFYYLTFDFSRILLPYYSNSMSAPEFVQEKSSEEVFEVGPVNIQDPFCHSFNVTGSVRYQYGIKLVHALIESCKLYHNPSVWIPGAADWGFCSLFKFPISEGHIRSKWLQDRHHSIELPSRPNAGEKIKDILEQGLLFQCNEMFSDPNEDREDSKILIKLHCRTNKNTWQGRDWVYKKGVDASDGDILEFEGLVSNEVAQSRLEMKRTVLCEFDCECRQVTGSNLILTLNFKESKFPPLVAIFLKEFIPKLFHSMK